MRKLATLLGAACAFGLAPFATELGPIAGSLLLVVLAVCLALAASDGLYALAFAAGGTGALASAILAPSSPAVAGAALVGLAFAERTTRVRGGSARLAHVGSALVGGALAGSLSAAYGSASPAVRVVAVVVASVLVALPLLVDADDALAHALDLAASQVAGSAAAALRQGAELRRSAQEIPLDPETARSVRRTWAALGNLAEARVRLERAHRIRVGADAGSASEAVTAMIDRKIDDHVAALSRSLSAIDTARAAEIGLDDTALRNVDAAGESLDDVSRVLADAKL